MLSISDINSNHAGEVVELTGWVHTLRHQKTMKFLILRDSIRTIQITAGGDSPEEVIRVLDGLSRESVIKVKGEVRAFKNAPGGVEIAPLEIEVLSLAESPLPLDTTGKVKANLDTRFDNRSLDLRTSRSNSIFRISSRLVEGFTDFLRQNDFLCVFTPCLMGVASEGGSEVFPVLYYNQEAYLRQDPQLHRQLTVLGGLTKVYDLGPSWRAEVSHTVRHLSEHRGCAIEQAFIKDESDLIALQEGMICHAIEHIRENCESELEILGVELEAPKRPFPELKFPEIYSILKDLGKDIPHGEEADREGEKLLGKYVKETYDHDFFFISRFPYKVKPFYVMKVDDEDFWTRSIDMMINGVEVSTGGQREHRYSKIMAQIEEKQLNSHMLEWFTSQFRYGAPPHGGFNIGIERTVAQLLGIENIREVALFPRDVNRIVP